MKPAALYQQGSRSSRQGGGVERHPMVWLTGLVPYIYCAWFSGIIYLSVLFYTESRLSLYKLTTHSFSVYVKLFYRTWPLLEQQIIPGKSIARTVEMALISIPWQWLYCMPVFTEITTSHRFKRTLVSPLCQPKKLSQITAPVVGSNQSP